MQSINYKIYFSLVLLGLSITLSAQDPFHIIYNVNDGLPSDEVYDLSIDENGSIWLTTDRGVCNYDGYDFKTFTTNDGLISNTNFEITKGQIKVFTSEGQMVDLLFTKMENLRLLNLIIPFSKSP